MWCDYELMSCKKVSPFVRDCREGKEMRLFMFIEERSSVLNVELV